MAQVISVPAETLAQVVPVTHTIGGVIACVPSPDGSQLALVDHDADGPFLALLPNDPAAFAPSVPKIALAWPAPVTPDPGRSDAARRP